MDKKSIIGFVLIGVIIFGFTFYQNKQFKKQKAWQDQQDSIALVAKMEQLAKDSLAMAALEAEAEKAGVSVEELSKPVAAVYKDASLGEASKKDAEIVALENGKVRIEFTTKGAQPRSVKVKDFYYYNKEYDSTGLYLIKPDESTFAVKVYTGEYINTKDFVFDVVESSDSVLVMRLAFATGGYIEQKYTLPADSYMLSDDLSFVDMDGVLPRNISMIDIDWGAKIPRCEKGYKNEKQYSKMDYYFSGDKKPVELGRGRDGSKRIDNRMKWVAFQQQFFSAILTAENEFSSADLSIKYADEDDPDRNLMTCTASLRAEIDRSTNVATVPMSFYFGPNDFRILKSFDKKYEKIIPLGGNLVGWISRFVIIPTFHFLNRFINSYGLIILIMTILLKIVISPLTIKSYMSSAKMSALKPEIDKLNAKYPKQEDAMKKQQAQMDLYKRAGVSPMGGCLPMLLQFPVLWAMFRFFPASIELRQQGFLWAEDLSAYDSILDFGFRIPLYGDHISLFALLMGVTMFFYSKMTVSQQPNADDPSMAAMNFMSKWMMPIMMLFICNNLSSGLSYYYFLSNLLTMGQNWAIKKWFVKPEKILETLKANSGKPVQKSKWQQRLEEAQKMQAAQAKNQKRR